MVRTRWATTSAVRPASSRARPRWTRASVATSMLDVASSSRRIRGVDDDRSRQRHKLALAAGESLAPLAHLRGVGEVAAASADPKGKHSSRPRPCVASCQPMRLIIARCSIKYTCRLSTRLPEAVRLLMIKSDGTFMVWSDGGGQKVKPQNWMTPPIVIDEARGQHRRAQARRGGPARHPHHRGALRRRARLRARPRPPRRSKRTGWRRTCRSCWPTRRSGAGKRSAWCREWPTDIGPVSCAGTRSTAGSRGDQAHRDHRGGRAALALPRTPRIRPSRAATACSPRSSLTRRPAPLPPPRHRLRRGEEMTAPAGVRRGMFVVGIAAADVAAGQAHAQHLARAAFLAALARRRGWPADRSEVGAPRPYQGQAPLRR
jgi:hypothetical protein